MFQCQVSVLPVASLEHFLESSSSWQVEKDGRGYAEDRRPNANMDPYTVARLITETINSPKAKSPKKKAAAKK